MNVKIRLKMYDGYISENKSAKNILTIKVTVLTINYFWKILFIYCCGPFQNAKPTRAAMTARVKIHTNLAGLVTMVKILITLMKNIRNEIPNAAIAFLYYF